MTPWVEMGRLIFELDHSLARIDLNCTSQDLVLV